MDSDLLESFLLFSVIHLESWKAAALPAGWRSKVYHKGDSNVFLLLCCVDFCNRTDFVWTLTLSAVGFIFDLIHLVFRLLNFFFCF